MKNIFEFIWAKWQRKIMLNPRRLKFSLLGAKVGSIKIYGEVKVSGWYHNISIGDNCTLNEGVFLNARSRITIADDCRISSHAKIYTGQLTIEAPRKHIHKDVVLERNVWVGSNVVILAGVRVGENSIIGAGAVVTKDVESNCFYAGNPAKLIKRLVL